MEPLYSNLFTASLPEEIGRSGFSNLALGDTEDGLDQGGGRGVNGNAIELQEYQCCSGTDTLVAVHKGMVLDDVKEIGRSHFKKIGMHVATTETSLRHGHRRFKKGQVTDALASPVSSDLIGVNLKDFLQIQKDRFHGSVG